MLPTIIRFLKCAQQAKKLLRQIKPDIIVGPNIFYLRILGQIKGVPLLSRLSNVSSCLFVIGESYYESTLNRIEQAVPVQLKVLPYFA